MTHFGQRQQLRLGMQDFAVSAGDLGSHKVKKEVVA
jgi:hypothetical protein